MRAPVDQPYLARLQVHGLPIGCRLGIAVSWRVGWGIRGSRKVDTAHVWHRALDIGSQTQARDRRFSEAETPQSSRIKTCGTLCIWRGATERDTSSEPAGAA